MATLNISLPEEMKSFVELQVSRGGYSTASEYIRELIREAQKNSARTRLEQLLLEGLENAAPDEAAAGLRARLAPQLVPAQTGNSPAMKSVPRKTGHRPNGNPRKPR